MKVKNSGKNVKRFKKASNPPKGTRKAKRKEERIRKKALRAQGYDRKQKVMKEWRLNKKSHGKNNTKKNAISETQRNNQEKPSKSNANDQVKAPSEDFLEEDDHHSLSELDRDVDPEASENVFPEEEVTRSTDLAAESLQAKRTLKKMKKKMVNNRKKVLLEENEDEDKVIHDLEKKLRLNKKSKALPKSFVSCGLDYLLDICNPDKMKLAVEAEKNVYDTSSQFEEDLALVKGKKIGLNKGNASSKKSNMRVKTSDCETEGSDNDSLFDAYSNDDLSDEDDAPLEVPSKKMKKSHPKMTEEEQPNVNNREIEDEDFDSEENFSDEDEEAPIGESKPSSGNLQESDSEEGSVDSTGSDALGDEDEKSDAKLGDTKTGKDSDVKLGDTKTGKDSDVWEDIYGRKRDKEGNIIDNKAGGKYIPPQLRGGSENSKKKEELERLKRSLKGLLNRLAESNMHSISSQIEDFYMRNSRNDMNETLIALYMEAIVSHVLTPERMILEHCMLTAILHANIGTEIGAYCLQKFVNKFDELEKKGLLEVGDKKIDNVLLFISHLYTFQIFDSCLLYDILNRLCIKFTEKEVELIMVILRSVGFTLRKDNPLALKELVHKVQKMANDTSIRTDNSRVRFMLDVLMTIKNNNMSKLPQYDPSLSEHLKKILKSMIRKGNYVTQLKISLDDLLKVEEQGRWWIVGSAWTGSTSKETQPNVNEPMFKPDKMSTHLMDLARKLRMNTESRKNIFCILMTAEDYNDAFEKLVKLGLKGHMEREVVSVLTRCLLSEKEFNPYYAYVANRCCQADRRHQMSVQCNLWDHFKEIDNYKPFQITNLAKFISVLFIEGALPISVLKVIEFVDMTKGTTRLVRQILLSVLYNKDEAAVVQVFLRATKTKKLHLFRESLRLFLHHLLLKNMNEESSDYNFLKTRIDLADRTLQGQS